MIIGELERRLAVLDSIDIEEHIEADDDEEK
jgi:hypothetical protein